MIEPPIPEDEAVRLELLRASQLLDSAPDVTLDTLVRVVARGFRVPTCAITLIDEKRQWFKARVGLELTETPRSCSFCAHVLWWPDPLIVLDVMDDQRFRDNPLVWGEPHIRFYVGVPVFLCGTCVGTLCLIDHRPHTKFESAEVAFLSGVARLVEERMQSTAAAPLGATPGIV